MNRSKVVSIVAYLMIVAGAIGILWSIQPESNTDTVELPTDAGIFYRMTVSGQLSGHVSGDFEVDVGTVNFYILDSEQYEAYSYDLDPGDSLYSQTGTSGSFSVDLPDTSTYYVCVDHGIGIGPGQTVTIHVKVSGITVMFMAGGAVALVIGVVLAILGFRMKAKEKAAMPLAPAPESQPTDVTMFDTKRKT